MIISIAAPTGGVGSSTFALLLTQERAKLFKTLLVDLSADPALDLYSGTAHIVPQEFNGNLKECSVELQDFGDAKLARVRLDQLALLEHIQENNEKNLDIILDVGRPNGQTIEFLATEKIPLVLVLTQDNAVLRAGDELLGQLRHAGVESGFIISKKDDCDPSKLADLDEIFDLIEEDFYGSISWEPKLRIQMNQGKPGEVSQEIKGEIQQINQKLNSVLIKNWDDTLTLNQIETSEEGARDKEKTFDEEEIFQEEETLDGTQGVHKLEDFETLKESQNMDGLEETETSSKEEDLVEPENVFSKIKQFFQNFGKGNE